ncbi:MAG: thiamine pyrophosphate-dependent enzyme [Patescibacteria group bacterium]
MASPQDFAGYTPTWCSGCGNWSIGRAIMMSLAEQGLEPSSLNMVFDIGCSGNMNDFVNAYAMHSLHGRSIANAIGIKLARHDMHALVIGGDGALLGEGGNHFLHACRGNHDITVILHDNSVYGLTTGQVAPTAQKGYTSKSTPGGIIERPVSGLQLALTQGASFIAQAFAGNLPQLAKLIAAGMTHTGFSLINVLQPCVTFNKVNTYSYYLQKSYQLPAEHNPHNYEHALAKVQEPFHQEKFPLGILYQAQDQQAYHQQLAQLEQPLVTRRRTSDYAPLLEYFQ